jgi:ABC-type transport system involved in Fe-S cluster assembly fused permease/ATPase subunit
MENKNHLISTQLINASLAMIIVIAILTASIITHLEISPWYCFFHVMSFCCFVISIFIGCYGIKSIDEEAKKHFNSQAVHSLLGIVLFLIGLLFI